MSKNALIRVAHQMVQPHMRENLISERIVFRIVYSQYIIIKKEFWICVSDRYSNQITQLFTIIQRGRMRFKITAIPAIISQITVVPSTFFTKLLVFVSVTWFFITEYRAKFSKITVSPPKKLSNTEYRNIARPPSKTKAMNIQGVCWIWITRAWIMHMIGTRVSDQDPRALWKNK